MRGSIKGDRGPDSNPLNNYENIGFHISNCPDPLKNHKATKPACKFWPSSKRHFNGHYRPASETPFKHRFAGEPMMVFSDKQISILGVSI